MRTPRVETRIAAVFAALAAGATAAILVAGGRTAESASSPSSLAVGRNAPLVFGDRVIVVLKTPSLGEHVAALGGALDVESEQAWTKVELSEQRLLLARLALQGVIVHPTEHFSRVLDGFSAVIPSSVVPVVERDANVAGVYPVRVAYPATISAGNATVAPTSGALAAAGVDGRGVTVALVDTGVDASVPALRGRVLPEIDIAPGTNDVRGTELAKLIARVAPGASLLPIRVAGAYAGSDQLIAGLDRAVDPNGDGDAHDAARIALVPLAEPFGGFPDGPEALAIAGARALDVLVVAPAGNDGPAGAAYGDLSAPGGAPDALTVGALDTRPAIAAAHVVVRTGLHTLFGATVPVAGALPDRRLRLPVVTPTAFFTRHGTSTVAGLAAAIDANESGQAAAAGAGAVLVDGPAPASAKVPVVFVPHAVLRTVRASRGATLFVGEARIAPNPAAGHVATFSSTGLAYDGSVKPDLVAPGVEVDGVTGTSAAAAIVAGAAAVLAQARPSLGADAIRGLLVGTAQPLVGDPVTAQGAGALDVGSAVAGEVASSPTTLALGTSTAPGWKVEAGLTLTNLSSRVVRIALGIQTQHEGAATLSFALRPSHVSIAPGSSALVHVAVLTTSQAAGSGPADGAVVGTIEGGGSVRVPWAIAFGPPVDLLGGVSLSGRTLTVDAGRITMVGGRPQIDPVSELDVALRASDGRPVGVVARLRDLLPGRYTLGLTGLGPTGTPLAPGRYVATVIAYPGDGGPPSAREVRFALR